MASAAAPTKHTTFEELYDEYLEEFPLDPDVKDKDSNRAYNYVISPDIEKKWENVSLFFMSHTYKTWDDLELFVSCVYRSIVGSWTKLVNGKKFKSKKTLRQKQKLHCPNCGFSVEAETNALSMWTVKKVGKLCDHSVECFKETQKVNTKFLTYFKARLPVTKNADVSELMSRRYNMKLKIHSFDQSKYYGKEKKATKLLRKYMCEPSK